MSSRTTILASKFSGILPSGAEYKVTINHSGITGFLTAYLYKEDMGVFWVEDVSSSLISDNYLTFKEALKRVLEKLEVRNNIQLINKKLNAA